MGWKKRLDALTMDIANVDPTEEPRRSVRATKGQNTKLDLLDQPAEPAKKRGGSNKKGTTKAKAASQEVSAAEDNDGSNDVIRCICGVTQQNDDDDEMWIACEKCNAWQHNVCMGQPTDQKVLDKMNYFCEECRPDLHQETVDALQRGDKIWETRKAAYAKEQEEIAKAKKGKKGRRKTQDRAATPQNVKMGTPAPAPADSGAKESVSRAGSTKRKTREESHDAQTGTNKTRKVSTEFDASESPSPYTFNPWAKPFSPELKAATSHLDSEKAKLVQSFVRNIVYAMKEISKIGVAGAITDADEQQRGGVKFAVEIEQHLTDSAMSNQGYAEQARAIFNNVKTNLELVHGLIQGSMTTRDLAVMPIAKMKSKQRQQQDQEMIDRAEKQMTLVNDDGPRIRRTHKGDEVVENDYDNAPRDEDLPAQRRRSILDPNHGLGARSRENTPGEGNDSHNGDPMDVDPNANNIRKHANPQGLSVDTNRRPSMAADNFDINSVYSKIETPNSAKPRKPSLPVPQQPQQNVQDADVDRLLNDTGSPQPEEAEYEPPEYTEDSSIVWRGKMIMTSIADFLCVARHVGGANLAKFGQSWANLLEDNLNVAGRIDPFRAEEYLCSLRYSQSVDISVVMLSPVGDGDAAEQYKHLYQHFTNKNKYGVLGTKESTANVRDTYLIPVAPTNVDGINGALPEFLQNIANHDVPKQRDEPMLLVALVIRHVNTNNGNGTESPTNRTLSISGQNAAMSPLVGQGPQGAQTLAQLQEAYYNGQQQQASTGGYDPRNPSQGMPPNRTNIPDPNPIPIPLNASTSRPASFTEGREVAKRVLGEELTSCEVANFLMTQAHKMVEKEWWVIRDVFLVNPASRENIQIFSQELEMRQPGGSQEHRGGLPITHTHAPVPPQQQYTGGDGGQDKAQAQPPQQQVQPGQPPNGYQPGQADYATPQAQQVQQQQLPGLGTNGDGGQANR